jgi:hypothetical protein
MRYPLLLCVVLAACVSPQQRQNALLAQAHAECSAFGYPAGSRELADCVAHRYDVLNAPQPLPQIGHPIPTQHCTTTYDGLGTAHTRCN